MIVEPARASGPSPPAAVLIVDDNAAKRMSLRVMLAPLDLVVVEADSGRAALRAVLRETFAVILMDVRMPILDGYETAKLIRQRNHAGVTPIIFVTAFGGDESETATAYASGAVDFIFTPALPDVVRAKVSVFVDLFEQSRQLKDSLESITALNASLRDSEVRAAALVQNVTDAIVTAGEDGLVQSFNLAAQRQFGFGEAEIIGWPLERIIAPDRHADFAAAVDAWRGEPPVQDARAEPTETVGRRQDGTCFPLEMEISRMSIGDRTITIGCFRDISGRKARAESERRRGQALRREAQRDRAAFEEAPIGSILADRDGRIERVNQAICAMTGLTAGELVGTHFLELAEPVDSERAHYARRIHDSGAVVSAAKSPGSATQHFEKRWELRNGRILDGRVAVTAIRDDAEEVTQLFAQIEDVTEARRTRRELEQAQFEMLARLAAAAEFRDDDTGQHTRRVGDLSVAIATRLGLGETEIELIRFAAPLHDIGKIAIPDAILGKPGKLTDEEFELVKTHTTVGAQMLTGSSFALLELAEQIARSHHERWDGGGYPAGLAGDAIPIAGRIVAVADVFDALTHVRPYKPAWSTEDALAEMADQAGRHFDPEVLEAFLSPQRELAAV